MATGGAFISFTIGATDVGAATGAVVYGGTTFGIGAYISTSGLVAAFIIGVFGFPLTLSI